MKQCSVENDVIAPAFCVDGWPTMALATLLPCRGTFANFESCVVGIVITVILIRGALICKIAAQAAPFAIFCYLLSANPPVSGPENSTFLLCNLFLQQVGHPPIKVAIIIVVITVIIIMIIILIKLSECLSG